MARKRIDVKLLLASFGIAVGVVLVVLGVSSSVTGREQQRLPDAIESVEPVGGAPQVLRQARVFVDLQAGYDAVLVINGVELETVSLDEVGGGGPAPAPGQQVSLPLTSIREPGNNTISFTPVEGAPIERFETGSNTAQVLYWRMDEGRERARSYTWLFTVV